MTDIWKISVAFCLHQVNIVIRDTSTLSLLSLFITTFSLLWNLHRLNFTCSRRFLFSLLNIISKDVSTNFLLISDSLQTSIKLKAEILSENLHPSFLVLTHLSFYTAMNSLIDCILSLHPQTCYILSKHQSYHPLHTQSHILSPLPMILSPWVS